MKEPKNTSASAHPGDFHTQMFMKALDSMGKLTDPMFGNIQPDETVDIYYNLSSNGKTDERGPWNSEPTFRYMLTQFLKVNHSCLASKLE